MAGVVKPSVAALFADKREIQRLVAEQSSRMQIPDDPTVTPQQARKMMLRLASVHKITNSRAASLRHGRNSHCRPSSGTRADWRSVLYPTAQVE